MQVAKAKGRLPHGALPARWWVRQAGDRTAGECLDDGMGCCSQCLWHVRYLCRKTDS